MKTLLVTPKNDNELLTKLEIGASSLSQDELEDIGFSKMLKGKDKTMKVSPASIMKKLSSI